MKEFTLVCLGLIVAPFAFAVLCAGAFAAVVWEAVTSATGTGRYRAARGGSW